MKPTKSIYILLSLFLIFSCETPEEPDTTPPTVTITFSESSVNEIISITCVSSDNEGVKKVELWIDGVSTGITDEIEPYFLDWNTTTYEDGSYVITVRSYDTSDNTIDSDPITLVVNNSNPSSVDIVSVDYSLDEMVIEWEESTDTDFSSYQVLYSKTQEGLKDTLITYSDRTITSFVLSDFIPTEENWFWIIVNDIFGNSTLGIGKSNNIDSQPTPVEINSIIFSNDSFILSWLKNDDNDFKSYHLYQSFSEDMTDMVEVFNSTDNSQTTVTILVSDNIPIRYYQLVVKDYWNLETLSEIKLGQILFLKTFCCSTSGKGRSVQQTSDGGYIMTGISDWMGDINLIKTNSKGNQEWNKTFGEGTGLYIEQTTDGGYIIIGTKDSYNLLIKIDIDGNQEWNKTLGPGVGYSGQQTIDGGYIILGYTESSGNGESDVWLIKTDTGGNEEWNKTYGGNSSDGGYSVQQTSDGGYIISGFTRSFGSDRDIWIIKVGSTGEEEWNQIYYYGNGHSIQQTTDGGYIITGDVRNGDSPGGTDDILLLKINSQGVKEWDNKFGYLHNDIGYDIKITTDGGYIITGHDEHGWGSQSGGVILIKTDSEGNTVPDSYWEYWE